MQCLECVCTYFQDSQADKNKFHVDLLSVVDGVSAENVLLVVGHLNCRVGSGLVGGDR